MNRKRWSIFLLLASIALILVPWVHSRMETGSSPIKASTMSETNTASALNRLPAHFKK